MTTIVRRRKLGMSSVRGIVEASTTGIRFANNYETIPDDNIYVRWGCTSNVPNRDAKVINSASGIHRVADKAGFRRLLNADGLCPRTWFSPAEIPDDVVTSKYIVRSRTHAQGRGLYVCRTPGELITAAQRAGPGYYINEFIDKVAEFRVFVCQGKVVWVAEKTPGNPGDVAWNVARGGRFDNVRWDNWNMAVIENAIAAWRHTGLHFAGMDIMLDRDGRAYCLEANSAPSQTSPYRQQCVAKALDWMVQTAETDTLLSSRFPWERRGGWRSVIHPGVWRKGE